jgi:hypothetical protein
MKSNQSPRQNFWRAGIGPTTFPYDVYDFTKNRKRDGPAQILANYTGYLQADAFGGYDGIYKGSDGQILEVTCSAHALRKFLQARSSSPADASLTLEINRQLYQVEDRAGPLDDIGWCTCDKRRHGRSGSGFSASGIDSRRGYCPSRRQRKGRRMP